MTGRNDEHVERLLQEAGERWRAEIFPGRDVEVEWFREEPRSLPPIMKRSAAAIAGVVMVGLAVLVLRIMPSTTLGPGESGTGDVAVASDAVASVTPVPSHARSFPASRSPLPPATPIATPGIDMDDVVHVGDSVTASGYIIEGKDEPAALCRSLDFLGTYPGCSDGTSGVPIFDVDVRSLPGWETGAGLPGSSVESYWVTDYLTVLGTWQGDGIRSTQITPADRPPGATQLRPVPCDPPPGGWPGQGTPDDYEPAWLELQNEVGQHPEEYVGLWWAVFDVELGPTSDGVQVVGTVSAVDTATARLASVFPYNLCVVQVPFSARDLNEVADRLSDLQIVHAGQIDPAIDRLVIRPLVLDEETAEAVQPFTDRIVLLPLVERQS